MFTAALRLPIPAAVKNPTWAGEAGANRRVRAAVRRVTSNASSALAKV
jgi:hypothetical protein